MNHDKSPRHIKTGFRTLNELLGGQGFASQSTIILRGDAGTGKTTLALQIARKAVARLDHAAIFILFEDVSSTALDDISHSYFGQRSWREYVTGGPDRLSPTTGEALTQVASIDAAHDAKLWKALQAVVRQQQIDGYVQAKAGGGSLKTDERKKLEEEGAAEYDRLAPSSCDAIVRESLPHIDLSEALNYFWEQIAREVDESLQAESQLFSWDKPLLLVIDSVNAMVQNLQGLLPQLDDRRALLAILSSFCDWRRTHKYHAEPAGESPAKFRRLKQATTIFTAEAGTSGFNDIANYVADTVVELRRESRPREVAIRANQIGTWHEDLLFCRVSKGRGLPIQRRDACYDFVANRGIRFFSTYSAQAVVSLFQENEPQRESIAIFRNVDVPALYPGVIIQEFERSALQRNFAIRRYGVQTPARHPLLLTNVDEYWVSDLRDQGLLHEIPAEQISPYFRPAPGQGEPSKSTEFDDDDQVGAMPKEVSTFIEEITNKRKYDEQPLYYSSCDADQSDGANQSDGSIPETPRKYFAVPHFGNVGIFVYRHDLLSRISDTKEACELHAFKPTSWEYVTRKCLELRNRGLPYKLLLETGTEDSCFTTILELGWAYNSFWRSVRRTDGSLAIRFDDGGAGFDRFVKAMCELRKWIHEYQIVPRRSSVDPLEHPAADWAFARHWYSTWVDVLTRRDDQGRRIARLPRSADCRVAAIPRFQKSFSDNKSGDPTKHYSCWGEWYLAIQTGSENTGLGVELINNMLSSQKVVERAKYGGGLPLITAFYDEQGSRNCFGTDLTYTQMRETFMRNARSRAEFYDFKRVARVLSGALQGVMDTPCEDEDVMERVRDAFHRLDNGFEKSL